MGQIICIITYSKCIIPFQNPGSSGPFTISTNSQKSQFLLKLKKMCFLFYVFIFIFYLFFYLFLFIIYLFIYFIYLIFIYLDKVTYTNARKSKIM